MTAIPALYTIGHSNLAIEDFLTRLRAAGVDAVVDVRSQPISKFSPQFNRQALSASLREAGIRYSFMGESLGGRPDNSSYYDVEGHVRYDLWAASETFQNGISRLIAAADRYRIALMCAEADPAHCHRHLLIARVLAQRGWPRSRILHIGSGESPLADEAIPLQAGLFEGESTWRSPQSVLHKLQPNTSSSA